MGYSVETLKNNELIIKGEREVNSSNLIGENAIKITLYETKISDKLKKDYKYFEVYALNLKVLETKGDIGFVIEELSDDFRQSDNFKKRIEDMMRALSATFEFTIID